MIQFLSPAGLWAVSGALAILVFYLMRRRYTPHTVPSTYLWKKAVAEHTASRPIQKLKKNLLMFLQLLIALMLMLSLMRPTLPGGVSGETVMIFDVSASMQAQSGNTSRLDEAVQVASRMISGMQAGDRVTLLAAGTTTRQLITRTDDHTAAQRALSSLTAENGTGDLNAALSLAEAMQKEISDLNIVVFSDTYRSNDPAVTVINASDGADNRAILSFSVQQSTGRALARVANYGADAEVTVECYADGMLADIRSIQLAAGEVGSVSFELPEGVEKAQALLVTPDAIAADNEYYWLRPVEQTHTVILRGDNVFLEKALLLRSDIQLIKTTMDDPAVVENAALIITQGDTLAFAVPGMDVTIAAEALIDKPAALSAAQNTTAKELLSDVTLDNMAVLKYHPLTGGTALMTAEGGTVMAVQNGAVVLGFDVHNSNLPLGYGFPVLVQNILSYLLPEAVTGVENADCGQRIQLQLNARTQNAVVVTPSGRHVAAQSGAFADTLERGVYTLIEDNERQTAFALHMARSESDVRQVAPGAAGALQEGTARYGLELTKYLLAAVLLLLAVEWWVSRRGH